MWIVYQITSGIQSAYRIKIQQKNKIDVVMKGILEICKNGHASIEEIESNDNIALSHKSNAIFYGIINKSQV